jgi:energy-coupling factor transporter ATP-binding protein EcfA2
MPRAVPAGVGYFDQDPMRARVQPPSPPLTRALYPRPPAVRLHSHTHITVKAAAGQPESFLDVMSNIFGELAGQQVAPTPLGAHLVINDLSYQPPGAPNELLTGVNLRLPPNRLGLIYGRSGSGKTTLLQLVAGLAQPTSGAISFSGSGPPSQGGDAPPQKGLSMQARMAAASLVFQFPERHFVGATLAEELTAGWPVTPQGMARRQALTNRAYQVLAAVGLDGLPLETPVSQLSDGYKRRVALAVQLVRRPALLLLDEPLAGLDWRTRGELIGLLAAVKRECTVLVVSHDLRELTQLVDRSWRMQPGGRLQEAMLPV